MSNNQNEAQLKANIAEFIGPLLRRLKLAKEKVFENVEMVEIIDQITTKVVNTKSSLDTIVNWNREQSGQYGKIERKIDSWIDHTDRTTAMNDSLVTELRDILDKLSHEPGEKASELPSTTNIPALPKSSNISSQEIKLSVDLEDNLEKLDAHSSLCLYSLGIFPENAKLRKRFVIYWWTGLGLLPSLSWEKAEKEGGNIFSDMVNKGFLISINTRAHNKVINLCTINPKIYMWLFSANKKEDIISPFFGDWFNEKVVVNLDQRYLNSKDISQMHNMQVVLLGNWHYIEREFHNRAGETGSKTTMPNDHIEVDGTDFLKNLGEKAAYLSLQGISGIEGVHESIWKLEKLIILDLRACHNLDKLPDKPLSKMSKIPSWLVTIVGRDFVPPEKNWFKKLAVLDVSECYLLDYMPIWIRGLSNLEVLKGFVVGSMVNKNRSCRVNDLSYLENLRKLTIRIAKGHLVTEDSIGLKRLHKLLVLTIIWGGKSNFVIPANSFPDNLEKLDIRCYPEDDASKLLNPAELKNLKRLYIRGGKLTKIPCEENWKIEILRLKFLKNLDTDWEQLRCSFTNLKYVEYVECPMLKNFPKDRSSWSEERDESFQNDNASVTSS